MNGTRTPRRILAVHDTTVAVMEDTLRVLESTTDLADRLRLLPPANGHPDLIGQARARIARMQAIRRRLEGLDSHAAPAAEAPQPIWRESAYGEAHAPALNGHAQRAGDSADAAPGANGLDAGAPAAKGGEPPAPAQPPLAGQLTPREREVGVLIASGLTNAQIARQLVVTNGTVANHVAHILSKLGCRNRAQVAVWFVRAQLGLAEADEGAE
jgi:DNA-binding CsgD family transcriptional regulator